MFKHFLSSSLATGDWVRALLDAKPVSVTSAVRMRGTVNKSRDSVAAARASREDDVTEHRLGTSFLCLTTGNTNRKKRKLLGYVLYAM